MRSPSGDQMKTDLKKGSWSHEEDEMLKSYINRYGIWNWSHMPRFAGLNRSGKSCKLRWMNYLKPSVKRGNFSQEEEENILHYHSLWGNRWSKIASKLPGRSDNDIKNYWHTHLKKRSSDNSMHQTTEQHDMNVSLVCDANIVETVHDHANDRFGSLWLETNCAYDSSSSNSNTTTTTTTKDHEVEFKDDYYDLCSPGTVKDLQSFWNQFCDSDNLELGTDHEHRSVDSVFPYTYNEAISSSYNFYNNDFDTINHLV
ncbi:hypothetical protein QVD17_19927 [Tagetes erecta]|uniref:Homeodomain-like protein n=1 Tax=Tagetes erecta TaxID=13708 RepID=A0AAD8NXN2_TARER|nr:hypothetical protein QVD17_19927 [Tagetes erecta]